MCGSWFIATERPEQELRPTLYTKDRCPTLTEARRPAANTARIGSPRVQASGTLPASRHSRRRRGMDFRISGLPVSEFAHVLGRDRLALQGIEARLCVADAPDQYPCRITLEDALPGEEVVLLTYTHQAQPTPYRSSGPIFVRRNATATCNVVNQVPDQQRRRLLSVRAYDSSHAIVDADVVPGRDLETLIERFFADDAVRYLHVHNARYGCYACRVDRVAAAT
jgi:hypothetical protein